MKKALKWIGLGLLALLLLVSAGFVLWAETPSQPREAALAALQSDAQVTVTDTGKYITFAPAGGAPSTGFIFYPGGHVEYRAYAPILHQIAAEGYLVALVPVRLNLAFFDIEAGAPVLADFPQIQTWVTGGHSLGGVASAIFAKNHPEIKGVIFWASYPADDSLKNSGVKMLSIYGTQDGGLDHGAKIEQYKAFQPADTQFVVIEGGNHGQFADYGPQPGDLPATIPAETQWEQVTRATVEFLRSFQPAMKIWGKILLGLLVFLLLAVLVGPFLVPVPPLADSVTEKELAEPDSRFVDINGLTVHYKEMGQGETTFILLHGFGASVFSWREVMTPFSALGRVIAFDRPAFGLTSRPLTWEGDSPYSPEAQVALVIALMDALGVQKAWLVGNSAGGTVSVATALAHPERVAGLILVDAAIYAGGGSPAWVRPLFQTPQMDHLGPLVARQLKAQGDDFIRTAYHNPVLVSAKVLDGYHKPLRAANWDRALWELTKASHPLNLPERLAELKLPVLVITGDDDRIVPTEQSLQLAKDIPGAQLAVIQNAGHLPHEEKPAEFMQAVLDFLKGMKP